MSSIMRRRSGVISAIGGLLQGWCFDSSNPVSRPGRWSKRLTLFSLPQSGLVQSGLSRVEVAATMWYKERTYFQLRAKTIMDQHPRATSEQYRREAVRY